MKKKIQGFTLIELLVVVAIIALLISILLPSLSRARELSKRLVCGANVKGIGTSCKIYANDNFEQWPLVPFDSDEIAVAQNSASGITYFGEIWELGTGNPPALDRADISEAPNDTAPNGIASLNVSTTRCFWMLVRTGDVTTKQFICPSSDDTPDDTEEIDRYYDFASISRISYGYQVPFGAPDTRASENSDNRLACAGDKGPYSMSGGNDPSGWQDSFTDYDRNTPPNRWKGLNSPNHGGRGSGEGQNLLFADGHVDFTRKPIVGIDDDNVYTQMAGFEPIERWLGNSPVTEAMPQGAGTPGFEAFDAGAVDAITDALIYP